MVADRWTRAVRAQLGLGRLLPLGGPADGAWIAESAAAGALRRAGGAAVPGLRLGRLRLALDDPVTAARPAVPVPPSGLPPGPLRVTAEFAATAGEPLPAVAERLRSALWSAAERELGLVVGAVDLRVTALLEEVTSEPEEPGEAAGAADTPEAAEAGRGADRSGRQPAPSDTASRAALGVPGVARLHPVLGAPPPSPPGDIRHVQIQIAVTAGHRPLDVARAVRAAVTAAEQGPVTVSVLVTAVIPPRRGTARTPG
ncbi:hypothetical protein SMD11_5157 [Streptomyces albireticuli]|uniref:Nucleopolyhedrovirus P10 family protein n=1 Tax=Streptomyces albireticuli TaxID=1940 RepID=A0A1Z2L8W4_9ACTN|nr:nucleopolyhedrovirus P10 family protein [Streptomyces albireticuli]ARZ70749.1 hypothetical protein SMD11_5157 [Streptomyces albireticuli]